jgi:hypothetical protein
MASVDRAAINFLTGKEQTDIESTHAAGRQISGKGAETYSLAQICWLPMNSIQPQPTTLTERQTEQTGEEFSRLPS